jgi:hypothetical protein
MRRRDILNDYVQYCANDGLDAKASLFKASMSPVCTLCAPLRGEPLSVALACALQAVREFGEGAGRMG